MKYCPKCETRYEEGALRFCTKDGSPLVDDEKPNFIQMPSDSLEADVNADADDESELTVIRRNVVPPATPPAVQPPPVTPPSVQPPPASALDDITFDANDNPPPRIVVPMDEEPPVIIPPRPTRPPQAYAPPQRSNTAIVVLLTIIGTTIILGGGGILIWLLQRDRGTANTNANVNLNMNVDLNSNFNTNYNSGSTNFNFNFNTNLNSNANANANKSPSPTPKPSPSPSVTPGDDANSFPTNRLPINSMSTPTPTPRPSSTPSNKAVNGGVLNGRAVNLATPQYPAIARQAHVSGQVTVEVAVDETGRVITARAVSGNPLLRPAAENAARQSRIIPSRINNENVRTTGLLVYNFRDN